MVPILKMRRLDISINGDALATSVSYKPTDSHSFSFLKLEYILYIVYCILYIVYCILYIVYCILYINLTTTSGVEQQLCNLLRQDLWRVKNVTYDNQHENEAEK